MRQRNSESEPSLVQLQEWQGRPETFVNNLKKRTYLISLVSLLISQPLMDCVVCYKTSRDVMEATPKPYVDCIQKPRLTQVFVIFVWLICAYFVHINKSCLLFLCRTWRSAEQSTAEKWATTVEHRHCWLREPSEATQTANTARLNRIMPKNM